MKGRGALRLTHKIAEAAASAARAAKSAWIATASLARDFRRGADKLNGVAIVTASALLVYMYTALRVGLARGLYGIEAPAITGHPMFDRHYRVQMNTLEQLIVFLPALWIFASVLSPTWAWIIGAVFVVGRILYAITYVIDPRKRAAGFLLGYLANVALLIGSIYGAFASMLRA